MTARSSVSPGDDDDVEGNSAAADDSVPPVMLPLLRQVSDLVRQGYIPESDKKPLQDLTAASEVNVGIAALLAQLRGLKNKQSAQYEEKVRQIRTHWNTWKMEKIRENMAKRANAWKESGQEETGDLELPSSVPNLMKAASHLASKGDITETEKLIIKDIVGTEAGEFSYFENVDQLSEKLKQGLAEKDVHALQESVTQALEKRKNRVHECLEELMVEMEALQSIFPEEMWLSSSVLYPIVLRFELKLTGIDCILQLLFVIREGYPLYNPVTVRSYVPPPFSDRLGRQEVTHLQELLESRAFASTGQSAIYDLIEEGRTWLIRNLDLMNRSLLTRSFKVVKKPLKGKHNFRFEKVIAQGHSKEIDRGEIESVIDAQVSTFVERLSKEHNARTSRSSGRKFLRESLWNVDLALEKAAKFLAESKDDEIIRERDLAKSIDVSRLESKYVKHAAGQRFTCSSCMESKDSQFGAAMRCDHWLCISCWDGLLNVRINEGQFETRCPGSSGSSRCSEVLEDDLIMSVVSLETWAKFQSWIQNSYVQSLQRLIKHCINPKCNRMHTFVRIHQLTVEDHQNHGSLVFSCECGACFCPFCKQDGGHWPLSCAQIALVARQLDESKAYDGMLKELSLIPDNEKFTHLNVSGKRCPNCSTFWEKNGGCNHMTCQACKFEWCWICQNQWSIHGSSWYECTVAKKTTDEMPTVQSDNPQVRLLTMSMGNVSSFIRKATSHLKITNELKTHFGDNPVQRLKVSFSSFLPDDLLQTMGHFLIHQHSLMIKVLFFSCLFRRRIWRRVYRNYEF
eukprot:TRINITY_DN3759_c0_g1_i2.p1 TRINITY_DN3759_c0_g1~~TRINITY_DN3759_c0_g1_i2.p1  ORF type:complete len:846 (-),score=186.73 TRINITY_DN3759_c0_g1_i2:406-2796(-)